MKEESLLLLSNLQKFINQVVLIDYIIIILGGDDWFYGKLSDVTESLKDEKFCIPGDSYFVNYDKITRFSKRKIWLSNGEEINITRKHSQAMSDYRLKYE